MLVGLAQGRQLPADRHLEVARLQRQAHRQRRPSVANQVALVGPQEHRRLPLEVLLVPHPARRLRLVDSEGQIPLLRRLNRLLRPRKQLTRQRTPLLLKTLPCATMPGTPSSSSNQSSASAWSLPSRLPRSSAADLSRATRATRRCQGQYKQRASGCMQLSTS